MLDILLAAVSKRPSLTYQTLNTRVCDSYVTMSKAPFETLDFLLWQKL